MSSHKLSDELFALADRAKLQGCSTDLVLGMRLAASKASAMEFQFERMHRSLEEYAANSDEEASLAEKQQEGFSLKVATAIANSGGQVVPFIKRGGIVALAEAGR